MIRGYTDHAANERTFLAWVRTGIAVIAFGFVIEQIQSLRACRGGYEPQRNYASAAGKAIWAARPLRWSRGHARWSCNYHCCDRPFHSN